ncbi:MAG: glycerol-3-phosphate 1-O-acyltransferase PlsY [Thermoflexales bacterium]|nr:glycerol-3-phosphate 1-O-acyltransferase PlsY [Thermoflexales bacterium]
MSVLTVLAAVVVAYLLGSIPVGYLAVRVLKGKDIRQVGSGRTGSTNALRAGGVRVGIVTALGDLAKGILAVFVARAIAGSIYPGMVEAAAGLAAVIGHNWPLYLGFKGGAGTVPSVGAAIAFWPWCALYLVPMFPLGLYFIGYASLASLIGAAVIALTFLIRAALGLDPHWWYVAYSLLSSGLVVWELRPNIKRLREGTERAVGLRALRAGKSITGQ